MINQKIRLLEALNVLLLKDPVQKQLGKSLQYNCILFILEFRNVMLKG